MDEILFKASPPTSGSFLPASQMITSFACKEKPLHAETLTDFCTAGSQVVPLLRLRLFISSLSLLEPGLRLWLGAYLLVCVYWDTDEAAEDGIPLLWQTEADSRQGHREALHAVTRRPEPPLFVKPSLPLREIIPHRKWRLISPSRCRNSPPLFGWSHISMLAHFSKEAHHLTGSGEVSTLRHRKWGKG